MRLRIILLWGLFVSCVQLRAQDWQEICAKFNSQPVITISDERVSIKFDYSFSANDENVIFRYEIFDSNGIKVSDKNFDINGMSYYNPLIFERQKFARYTPPFYVDASIRWKYSEGEYFELAATDKIPFAFNATSSYTSTSTSSSNKSTTYQGKKVCSYCNGTGFVKCSHCDGYGYLEPGFGPRGNGKLGGGNTTCPECRGAKTKECPLKKEYPQLHLGGNRNSDTAHGSQGVSNQNTASTSSSSYSIPSSSTNSFAPPSSSSSSNTNPKYKASDPNLVDNSEEISRCEKVIEELENQKLHCSYCNGTHKIPTNCNRCRGTGTIKMGYYTPQFFKCNYCGGTGRTYKPCIECQKTDVSISISRNMLKTYKETHGMTKETAAFYHEHNSKMAQMDRDYQNTINAIAEPYLNGTRKSNSSNSSTSSSSKTCTYCGGTGVSKIGILGSGGTGVAYTNAAGEDCPYCDEYDYKFHHHDRCTCKLK